MILSELWIKNLRSFGNNKNTLKFDTDTGNLVLIAAPNGAGKSSLISSIDYAIFGKVKGNNKTIKLSSLPNRINKNLEVGLKFNSYNTDISIERGTGPSFLRVSENNIECDINGKANLQEVINKYVDFDLDSWKSFISLSINNFKNFMSLTPEDKRILLDRLFNLELINMVGKMLTAKKKQYVNDKNIFNAEITSFESSIEEFNKSIEKIKEIDKKGNEKEILEITEDINSKKEEFLKFKSTLQKCSEKRTQLEDMKTSNIKQMVSAENLITSLNDKKEIYKKGKCPTCESDLSDSLFNTVRTELDLNLQKTNKLISDLKKERTNIKNRYIKLNEIEEKSENSFSDLKSYLMSLKTRLNIIKSNDNDKLNESVGELNSSIEDLNKKLISSQDKYDKANEDMEIIEEMISMFSNDGLKKSLISKIIKPINKFIKENMDKMNLGFNIELDDKFSATVQQLGQSVDVDTLSTGELKKCNIAIMLAYLKLIRMKRHINILFLDEIFSSIDIEGIYDILSILRDFAHEYKINVFLIHHAMLDHSMFDKVMRINKDITSNIYFEK